MKSERTQSCDFVWKLPGGDESNDLHGYHTMDEYGNMICVGIFVPTDEERQKIAAGENIGVAVWGKTVPPMTVIIDDAPLGPPPPPSLDNACLRIGGCENHAQCAELGHCSYKGF